MSLLRTSVATLAFAATACGAVTPIDSSSTGVLKSLTAGDVACYAEIADATGKTREVMAAFEVCEQAGLVGKKVVLVTRMESVSAASCQGDPECTARENVMLVVEMRAAAK